MQDRESRDKIIIFGTGGWYQNNKAWLHDNYDVVAFFDNNQQRQGTLIDERPVLAPSCLNTVKYDFIVIASMYVTEIHQQLTALGVLSQRIISKDDLPQREQQLAYLFQPLGPCEVMRANLSSSCCGRTSKRALICASGLTNSGVERVLSIILQHVSLPGFHIDLLLLGDRHIHFFQALPEQIQLHYLFSSEAQILDGLDAIKLGEANELAAAIVPNDYDLYVAFNEGYPTKLIAGVEPIGPARKLAWVHLDLFAWHSSSYAYSSLMQEQAAYQKFDRLVFVSRSVERGFWRRFSSMPLCPSSVIHNPFLPVENSRSNQNRPFSGLTCLSMGRMTGQKRFDLLLQAQHQLCAQGVPFNLILLGEGEEQPALVKLVSELGLTDRVLMPGFVDNSEDWFGCADFYVSTSIAEGYPMVIGEALLHGMPVLASDCSGNLDILADGKFGQLFSSGSVDALVSALHALLTNTNALIALRHKSVAAKTDEQFDFLHIMSAISEVLQHDQELK